MTKVTVKISVKSSDVAEVLRALSVEEIVEKIIEIPFTKENMDYLCKSNLILDWNTTESTPPLLKKVPDRGEDLIEVERVILPSPTKKIVTQGNIPPQRQDKISGNSGGMFSQLLPDFKPIKVYTFLQRVYETKIENPELALGYFTVPNLQVQDTQGEDKTVLAILDYLEIMLGYQSVSSKSKYLKDRLTYVWDKIPDCKDFVSFFETMFSCKLAR